MSRSIEGPKGVDFRTRPSPIWLEARANGYTLALHVQPGARRTAVVGPHGARLKLAVASPPVDGRANAALIAFLAERFGVPRARVTVLAGANSREKRVSVDTDLPLDAALQALAPASGQ
jgi:uncharacterized protein (TIGR00251 family)